MVRPRAQGVVVLAVLAWAGSGTVLADKEEEFKSLFNGKNLTGWRYPGKNGASMDGKTQTPDKRFEVKEGAIVTHSGTGLRDLYTNLEYNSEFHLKLQFRASFRAEGGVSIRSKQLPVRDYPNAGPYKNLKHFKYRAWNDLDILIKGNVAECRCNGEVLENALRISAMGQIGLQSVVGKVEFRNVRIKE
jgi:hypothetical protein